MKIALWTISLAGLSLIAFIFVGDILMLRHLARISSMYHHGGHFHDTYVVFGEGSNAVSVFPRVWAASLGLAGILLVATGQYFILRRGSCSIINGSDCPAPPPHETAV